MIRIIIADPASGSTQHGGIIKDSLTAGYGSDISDQIIFKDSLEDAVSYATDNSDIIAIVRSYADLLYAMDMCKPLYPRVQTFYPLGSNSFIELSLPTSIPFIVTCGAGDPGYEDKNNTGYGQGLEFWDRDNILSSGSDASSFANGYIIGKILKIKDTLGCSWWEARYRARQTAQRNESNRTTYLWDLHNGYGFIDSSSAINTSMTIIDDPYIVYYIGNIGSINLTSDGNKTIYIRYNLVDSATSYNVESFEDNIWKSVSTTAYTVANYGTYSFRYKASNSLTSTNYSSIYDIKLEAPPIPTPTPTPITSDITNVVITKYNNFTDISFDSISGATLYSLYKPNIEYYSISSITGNIIYSLYQESVSANFKIIDKNINGYLIVINSTTSTIQYSNYGMYDNSSYDRVNYNAFIVQKMLFNQLPYFEYVSTTRKGKDIIINYKIPSNIYYNIGFNNSLKLMYNDEIVVDPLKYNGYSLKNANGTIEDYYLYSELSNNNDIIEIVNSKNGEIKMDLNQVKAEAAVGSIIKAEHIGSICDAIIGNVVVHTPTNNVLLYDDISTEILSEIPDNSRITLSIPKAYTKNIDFYGKSGIKVYLLPGASYTGTISNLGTNSITPNVSNPRTFKAILNQRVGVAPLMNILKNDFGDCDIRRKTAGNYSIEFQNSFNPNIITPNNTQICYNDISRDNLYLTVYIESSYVAFNSVDAKGQPIEREAGSGGFTNVLIEFYEYA